MNIIHNVFKELCVRNMKINYNGEMSVISCKKCNKILGFYWFEDNLLQLYLMPDFICFSNEIKAYIHRYNFDSCPTKSDSLLYKELSEYCDAETKLFSDSCSYEPTFSDEELGLNNSEFTKI